MPRLPLFLLALVAFSCSSVPNPRMPLVLKPSPSTVPGEAGLERDLRAALIRTANLGRFEVVEAPREGQPAATGEYFVEPLGPGELRVRLRVFDAGGGLLAWLSTGLALDQRSIWPWTLRQRWRTFDPAVRLTELLGSPRGNPVAEARLDETILQTVRQAAVESDSVRAPAVAAAYRSRFGRELATALDRPEMVWVAGGNYYQGNEQGETDESPSHSVTVGGFLIGRTEVTQAQYQSITGTNPSLFQGTPDAPRRPVERVSWFEAVEFCNLLSKAEGLEPVYTIEGTEVTQNLTRRGYRLPTEAEWEWAARGGLSGRGPELSGGDDPRLVAWTDGTTEGPYPVAEKDPNPLGLYDLSGNVWEWCWDWYGRYEAGPATNPTGPEAGILRVGRGGSWHAAAWNARVTARSFDTPATRSNNLGFRVVRSLGY